ncbi:hypothetical protein AB0L85_29295 [Streptomyces sp. NPDC052051]|uniref:hypothetical protein n=1 Tax=Streptomyces sp. NPDC052051 TaxID=3154649 RepID=UPI00343EB916
MTSKDAQGKDVPPQGTSPDYAPQPSAGSPEPAGGWTEETTRGLVVALERLPRRLARQELLDEEKGYTREFDKFYAAMQGAADEMNGRTGAPFNPAVTAFWSEERSETKARVDTRLEALGLPEDLSSIIQIRLRVGADRFFWTSLTPNAVQPEIRNRRLRIEVPVRAGSGPFGVTGTVKYKTWDGEVREATVLTAVPHRRLSLPETDIRPASTPER